MATHAVLATVADQPGMLFLLTKVFADHGADIRNLDIHSANGTSQIYFELTLDHGGLDGILADLRSVRGLMTAEETPSFTQIYGKRIIVMGGCAQVGLVAMGAVSEADRHNIRGEHISVD